MSVREALRAPDVDPGQSWGATGRYRPSESRGCARHSYCAFGGDGEQDRCPWCHTTQQAVERCHAPCCRQSVWHHVRVHEHADAAREVQRAKDAQRPRTRAVA